MTSRRLAVLELVLGVIPATLFWLLASAGLVIVAAKVPWIERSYRSGSPGSLALTWGAFAALFLVAGLIGLSSLWIVVLRSARSKGRSPIRLVELAGLTIGVAAALPIALQFAGARIPVGWRVVAGAAILIAGRHALSSRKVSPPEAV